MAIGDVIGFFSAIDSVYHLVSFDGPELEAFSNINVSSHDPTGSLNGINSYNITVPSCISTNYTSVRFNIKWRFNNTTSQTGSKDIIWILRIVVFSNGETRTGYASGVGSFQKSHTVNTSTGDGLVFTTFIDVPKSSLALSRGDLVYVRLNRTGAGTLTGDGSVISIEITEI